MDGSKTFELRENDRNFHVGDTLMLREYDNKKKEYGMCMTTQKVTSIIYGPQFGIKLGYCVMSIHGINWKPDTFENA